MKPLLASDVLASERAPLEPGRGASRLMLGLVAAGLVSVGLAIRAGMGPGPSGDATTIAFCAAGTAATLGILPFPYALRAGVSLLVGAVLMLLGLRGSGPLAGLVVDGGELRDLVRVLTVTLLPGALLLRARYASFGPTRWILAGALVTAVPFVTLEVMLATATDVAMVTKIAAVCAAGAVGLSVFALFGDGSLGSHSPVAWLILVALPVEIGVRAFTPLADSQLSGWMTYPITAVALFLTALPTSIGTYQLAAAVLGPRAQNALKKKLLSGAETRDPPLNLVKR